MFVKTLFFTLIFAFTSFQDLSPLNTAADYSSVFLIPQKGMTIAEPDVIQVYFSGWEYQESVEIYGYTATDDLWTIIAYKSSDPALDFDKIRIDLTQLERGSTEWEDCLRDIVELAGELPVEVTFEIVE